MSLNSVRITWRLPEATSSLRYWRMFCVFLFCNRFLFVSSLGTQWELLLKKGGMCKVSLPSANPWLYSSFCPLFWLMAGGQWLHHFGRIAVECADAGSNIKLDSMKLTSAMILWDESLDFSVSPMEEVLSVFKIIGKKFGRFWTVLRLGKRSKQL